jgi:UDP-N-acetylmuramate dehydrogenase
LVVLGGGSNVLISDQGLRGAAVLTTEMTRIARQGLNLVVDAGSLSHQVALAAQQAELSGAEFLSWLPGTIGGACFMNARAFGGEIAQILRQALVVSADGQLLRLSLVPEQFAYKQSPLQTSGQILVEATLSLQPGESAAITTRMNTIEQARKAKRELDFPSCGCVFKNNYRVGISSGQLIEQCGLKGYRVGDAQVSPFHANFIINLGQATAAQVRQVIDHVQATVATRLGHHLELEVQLLQ